MNITFIQFFQTSSEKKESSQTTLKNV